MVLNGIISTVITMIVNLISQMGYPGIFVLMILEGMLLPIPSEVVMLFGGYLVYEGKLTAFLGIPGWVVLLFVGSFGNLIGALIAFYIGKYGGRPAIVKYGRYVLLDEKSVDRITLWFHKYGEISVFLTRLVPIFRTFISIPAGIARMNVSKFSLYTITGMFIWDALLIYFGISLGPGWRSLLVDFDRYTYVVIAVIIALLIYFGYHAMKRRRSIMDKNAKKVKPEISDDD